MAASRLVNATAAAMAAVGLALLAAAWHGGGAEAPAAATAAAGAPTPAPLRPTTAPAAPPVLQATPPPPDTPRQTALLAAPPAGLRASVHAALAAPGAGGRLHARVLARRCADLEALPLAAVDANDPRHQRAVARQAALRAGCGQFSTPEWERLVNIGRDEPGDDPLLALLQSDADDAALLQAVVARPDALLLDELGPRLLLRRDGSDTPALYFDGVRHDDEAGRALLLDALQLLPCHFGLDCGEADPAVWMACLRGDGCLASRFEQVTPEAAALAGRIAAALREGALQRLLPPRR